MKDLSPFHPDHRSATPTPGPDLVVKVGPWGVSPCQVPTRPEGGSGDIRACSPGAVLLVMRAIKPQVLG